MTVFADGTSTLREMGWKFNETLILDKTLERNNIHNLTLQIPSRIEFNNTKISCLGSVHDPAISDPVYLIIKGTGTFFLRMFMASISKHLLVT